MSDQPNPLMTIRDPAETRRLESLRKCVTEFNVRRGETVGIRRICQLVRVWPVSTKSRSVMPEKAFTTYASGIGDAEVAYLVLRPCEEAHVVIELFSDPGKVLARLLVVTTSVEAAIRGMYLVRAEIKSPVPSSPEGVVFNKGYFQETATGKNG